MSNLRVLFPQHHLYSLILVEVAESTRAMQQLISVPLIIIFVILQIVLFARSIKLKKQLGYPKDKPGWPKRQYVRLLSLEKTEPFLNSRLLASSCGMS